MHSLGKRFSSVQLRVGAPQSSQCSQEQVASGAGVRSTVRGNGLGPFIETPPSASDPPGLHGGPRPPSSHSWQGTRAIRAAEGDRCHWPAPAPTAGPPPDGKYERVTVEGTTVAMVNVMAGGTVVLVDTDGKKPRTWEEQYKRKRATGKGELDLHKTDANHNGSFEDDAVDREGLWVIDGKGNILKR